VTTAAPFYDSLAPHYHLLCGDWEAAIARRGAALARLLATHGIHPGATVLDAACGIGTQTLGLLANGYAVTASDLSPGAIARLQAELRQRGLIAPTSVDNLRTPQHAATGAFDAVIACDNSIPHLLTDTDLLACFRSCLRCLRPGGVAVFSVRDYAQIPRVTPDVRPYATHDLEAGRFLAVQVWDWDGDHYDLRIYLKLERHDGSCTTEVIRSRYYAVTIDRLLALMQEAGFVGVQRLDDVLFQPVLLGTRSE